MLHTYTMEYWMDEGWYVGRLKEIPGIFSQGKTVEELEVNLKDAYKMMSDSNEIELKSEVFHKEIGVDS
ncbi:MAG: type II toxin-antitoxin system HicB family antitoxin [Brevinematales bacterium]|nr:type II toxin-antitoxin system HicB family antitoxin [Brevinematales bacterium]